MSKIAIPTIHGNGTSGTSLKDALQTAYTKIGLATDAMCAVTPHGRDYYVQGPDAYSAARKEHDERMNKLRTMRDEIMAIWEGIDNQTR